MYALFFTLKKQFDTSKENKNTLIIETVLLISIVSFLCSVFGVFVVCFFLSPKFCFKETQV